MELVELRNIVVWKTKFEHLISEVGGKLCGSKAENIDPKGKIEDQWLCGSIWHLHVTGSEFNSRARQGQLSLPSLQWVDK
ncbi:hypothetical protein TNCV_4741851 [Trichonephila clavipes]|nr:hypothetical protein TNCV_4741851 [Trichonephila clavipes]